MSLIELVKEFIGYSMMVVAVCIVTFFITKTIAEYLMDYDEIEATEKGITTAQFILAIGIAYIGGKLLGWW